MSVRWWVTQASTTASTATPAAGEPSVSDAGDPGEAGEPADAGGPAPPAGPEGTGTDDLSGAALLEAMLNADDSETNEDGSLRLFSCSSNDGNDLPHAPRA